MMDTGWVDGGESTRKTRDPSTLHISQFHPFQGTRSPTVALWMCKPNVGVSRYVKLDNIRGCWSSSPCLVWDGCTMEALRVPQACMQ